MIEVFFFFLFRGTYRFMISSGFLSLEGFVCVIVFRFVYKEFFLFFFIGFEG